MTTSPTAQPSPAAEPGGAIPQTKTARHALIAQLLTRTRVRSQSELRDLLAERGVTTTQATLSRDLVELRATKVRSADGAQVYAVPEAGAPGQVQGASAQPTASGEVPPAPAGEREAPLAAYMTARLARWCADLLVTAEWAGQMLVLRTPAGAAQLLASAVDDAMLPGVLGCIAGDDTVLVITHTEEISAAVATELLTLADPGRSGSPATPPSAD